MIESDSRGRLTLGSPHARYLVEVEDDGTTILTPAVVVAKTEGALLERPDLLDLIETNRRVRLTGRPGRPPARDHLLRRGERRHRVQHGPALFGFSGGVRFVGTGLA